MTATTDDYTADSLTNGSVAVDGIATGDIETGNDFDWFAVQFVAGRTYVIDIEGADTGAGTLLNPVLRGVYDADGNRIAGTQNNDGGDGRNARLTFTATETATYYIAARGRMNQTGDYTVRVTDNTPDLGDITDLATVRFESGSLDGSTDAVAYWHFTLSEAKTVGLRLRRLDADADLVLEDADGNELYSSREGGTANERLNVTLLPGTYYVRVEAQGTGANDFRLRYGVSEPDPAVVAELQSAQQQPQQPIVQVPEEPPLIAQPQIADDYTANIDTTGTVEVDGSTTGEIEVGRDRDWFAVTLEAGKVYAFDLTGSATGDGTLFDPNLRGIYDDGGNRIAGTANDDSGIDLNSHVIFTADAAGTYYVAAGAWRDGTGTYTLSVTEWADDYAADESTTGTVEVDDSTTGEIEVVYEYDWIAVDLEAGKTYRFDVMGAPTDDGTLANPFLRGLFDADGNLIDCTMDNDSGAGNNARVTFTADANDTYYVAAGGNGDTGTYTVAVEEVM